MTHRERIAHSQANRTCFACAHYCGQFSRLSALCLNGGLDPENAAEGRTQQDAEIRATVRWGNSCPRFAATLPMEKAA